MCLVITASVFDCMSALSWILKYKLHYKGAYFSLKLRVPSESTPDGILTYLILTFNLSNQLTNNFLFYFISKC